MKFEDYLVIAGILALAVFLFCLKLMACVGFAYGLLWGGNYLAGVWGDFPVSAYEIEVTHILIGALFIAVLLRSAPDLQSPINDLDRSVSYAVGGVEQRAHDIFLKLDSLDEIRSSLEFIQQELTDIRNDIENRD